MTLHLGQVLPCGAGNITYSYSIGMIIVSVAALSALYSALALEPLAVGYQTCLLLGFLYYKAGLIKVVVDALAPRVCWALMQETFLYSVVLV
jgi:hypothetical protein